MFYLNYSRDWKRNADAAVREVCKAAGEGSGKRIYIVPEQNSFDAERALCREGGDAISRYAEVLSFSRLADRVFAQVGGAAVSTLDQSGRMIAMAGALEQLRPRLRLYGGQITKPEFLQELLRVVDEFHSCGLRSQDIRQARSTLAGPLADKLEELCLILEGYDAVCAGALQDPAARLDRLRDALYDSDYAKNARIVVEGFSDFTNQELSVLEALLLQADRVSVYLTCDRLTGGQAVFSAARRTARTLQELARRHEVLTRSAPLLESTEPTELNHLAANLFAPGKAEWPEPTDRIVLWAGESAAEECEALVGSLQRRLLAGARYRDLAVAYTDETLYGPLLENLLRRYQIPAYFSGSREILRRPMVRGVLYGLEAAACGMDADSISEYLKSGCAPVDVDEADRLENYGYVWRLRGSGWESDFTRNPRGLQKDEPGKEDQLREELTRLNEIRSRAIGPLTALRRDLGAASDTADQVKALEAFLEALRLREQLQKKVTELLEAGSLQEAQELSQLYEILLRTMEQIYGVLGRTVRSPEDFYRFFRAALTQNTVGTIPATLDSVRVGSLSAMRNLRVSHLLVLGASDGLLPAYKAGTGLITEQERRRMKAAGLQVAPEDSEQLDRELLTAYTVLTAPTESLFLSCRSGSPSYLFTRLGELFSRRTLGAEPPLPVTEPQLAALLAAQPEPVRAGVLQKLPELAAQTQSLLDRAAYSPGRLDRAAVRALYDDRLSLTASRIDRFASCQYAYYLGYGLKLREQRQAEVDASIYGVFVHYVLEHTLREVEQAGGFRAVSLEQTLELAQEACNRFVNERLQDLDQVSQRWAYLFRRNFREVLEVVRELYEELRQSEFVPVSFELAFENQTAIPITGDLAVGSLRGVVDRVDLYTTKSGRTYLRVIDYKTGQKDFDYTDLAEGIGLQMLIYLFALTREAEQFYGKPLSPAGVLYFPARYGVESAKSRLTPEEAEKEHRKSMRRKGLLLEDEELLYAMEPQENPVYLPFRYVKKTQSREGSLVDRDQLALLARHVRRSLNRIADAIWTGDIEARPYWRGEKQNACRWCEYREICHIDSGELPLRSRRALKKEEFWQRLREEEADRG